MEKKTILIVDDSPISLRHAQNNLKADFITACSKSGKRALEYLTTHIPDLIILDLNMPEMSGFEVYEHIKSDQHLKGIPVLFLTGVEDDDLKDLPNEMIIRKPVEPDRLLALAKRLIG